MDGVAHDFVADALNPICTLPLSNAPLSSQFEVLGL
jgi:hypothetical protein